MACQAGNVRPASSPALQGILLLMVFADLLLAVPYAGPVVGELQVRPLDDLLLPCALRRRRHLQRLPLARHAQSQRDPPLAVRHSTENQGHRPLSRPAKNLRTLAGGRRRLARDRLCGFQPRGVLWYQAVLPAAQLWLVPAVSLPLLASTSLLQADSATPSCSGLRSEWIATALIVWIIATATKRNPLSYLSGIPFHRLMSLHKLLPWFCLFFALVHTVAMIIRANKQQPWRVTLATNSAYGWSAWVRCASFPRRQVQVLTHSYIA